MVVFCTRCGASLDDQARFCTRCGQSTMPATPVGMGPAGAVAPNGGWASSAAPRRLRRIMSRKKIAGVCAGFAEYFDMDVTLMRLIWVGLLLMPPNIGIIGYIVACFVLPKE